MLIRRAPITLLLAVGALLSLFFILQPVEYLSVDIDGVGSLRYSVKNGEKIELTWMHSVSDIPIREVFEVRDGRLWLMETHNPWFAAGLGEMAGRGRTVADPNHGIAIVDINEDADGMVLRIGSPGIHHTLVIDGGKCDLSLLAPHKRARFEVVSKPRVWGWLGVRCREGSWL